MFFIESMRSGGKERRLTELIKVLRLRQDIQTEITVMSEDLHYKELLDLGIKINYIIRKTKKDIYVFFKFYDLCKSYKPDIVHCWDGMTAIYSIPACKLLNIRLINGLVMDSPEHLNFFNKKRWRAKLTFPFSDMILGNSKAGLITYKSPKSKSRCIYNGFNFERIADVVAKDVFRNQLEVKTKYVIGMVASFSEKKDYKTFFLAAQLLLKCRKDITFWAIGSDTDSPSSKSLIKEEFSQYFSLLGLRINVETYINAMDICILSTFNEGISNSILEYMALGKPVIATDGGGTREIVENGETGFLIGSSRPEELSGKMNLLLDNAELREKMGIAGKQRIQKYFSIAKMESEFVSAYKMAE